MFGFRRALLAAAAFVAVGWSGSAYAVPVTTGCYGSVSGFSLTTDPGSSCVGAGGDANDINNPPAPFAGYTQLDKSDSDDGTASVAGWLTAITFTGTAFDGEGKATAGTFTVTPGTGYDLTTLILAFRDGRNHEDGYGAFLLAALTGSWAIINPPQGLSHFTLYGEACPLAGCPDPGPGPGGEVPLPPAIWLFASALAGMGLIGARRRRRRTPSSF